MSTVSLLEEERAMLDASEMDGCRPAQPLDDETGLYEMIRGQRVECPMSFFATWINTRLSRFLAPFVDEHQLGTMVNEAIFILDDEENEQRRPDQAFLSKDTWPLDRPIPKKGELRIVPDLAIEVISPNDLYEEVLGKVDDYFAFRVKQVWVVSPVAEKIYIYEGPLQVRVLGLEGELDGGTLLPGFRLKFADLFGAAAEKK